MAAAASFTSSVASRSHVRSLKATPKVLASSLGFSSSIDVSSRMARHLLSGICDVVAATGGRGGGAILGARMVAAPTISNPAPSLDFDTSVFKIEKVNLAGHEESLRLDIDKPSSKINYSPLMKDASFQQLKKLNTSREKSLEYISHDLNGKLQTDVYSGSGLAKISVGVCGKELERRRKIGLANKGRTPWNKGIKHSEETRMRIKKKTIEALKDPKVRKKMSERPHSHSDQSKARISFSLRRFWHESLKHKRLQENLYFSWARYIAEAAKQGGDDQRELGWDSFQKIKADINFQYLQEREEKALAWETAKLIAEKVARDRAANNAQKRKRKEEQAKTKSLLRQNLLNRKKKNDLARDLKLIERLAKIQDSKRQLKIPVSRRRVSSVGSQPSVENLDLEFIKEEKMQRSVSLADQLQTLKDKKFEVCGQLL